jgi:hypothetical protein
MFFSLQLHPSPEVQIDFWAPCSEISSIYVLLLMWETMFHAYINNKWNLEFEVLTAIVMKSSLFWDIMPCYPLKFNRRFGRTCRHHLRGRRINQSREPAWSRQQVTWPPGWSQWGHTRWWRQYSPSPLREGSTSSKPDVFYGSAIALLQADSDYHYFFAWCLL